MTIAFSDRLLTWYDEHGRKDLPWHMDSSAYRIWLSEIMLQQTQVATVIPYFQRFVQRFPDIDSLATASLDEIMSLWAGLGYYARARNLHRCAQTIHKDYHGQFPDDPTILMTLPGIGRSTAGAIAALAFDRYAVILDGNVKRVLTRYRAVAGWPGASAVQRRLWDIADELTPTSRSANYTQAIMDLGSLVCTRLSPDCASCPVSADCLAREQGNPQFYPEKRQRKKLATREVTALLCYQPDGSILLERRPPAGIWGGLWSLPECQSHEDPETFLKNSYGYSMDTFETVSPILHTFTHFQLRISPIRAQVRSSGGHVVGGEYRWCQSADIERYGLPQPVQKLVTDFFQSGQ